jgi:PKD domain-containing protein
MASSKARIAVCAATIFAACSHPSQSPTTPSSSSPDAGVPPLSVLVDGQPGATAIAGVSEVTINVGGTFGGDTKLRYQVDYGDGQSSAQGVAKHVYANTGTFHLIVTATDAAGRQASTAQDVSVSAVNGAWFQFGVNDAVHQFEARRMSIQQDGTQVRGTYVEYGKPDRGITGQLSANRRITLTTNDGAVAFEGVLPLSLSDAAYPLTLMPLGGTGGQTLRFDPVPSGAPSTPPKAVLRVRNEIPDRTDGSDAAQYLFTGWESTFDASQSTGDGLSFVIDFGDGTFASSALAHHVLLTPPSRLQQRTARAFVVDRFGRAGSETASFWLTGISDPSYYYFTNSFQNPATGNREYRVLGFGDQNGTQVTGIYGSNPDGGRTRFTATLSGANHIHLRLDDGSIELDGTFTLQPPPSAVPYAPWIILRVRGGSADGAELTFSAYD